MTSPWTEGPRELLQHAADHLRLGSDFDRRMAMISIDNAVELSAKTFLGLPARVRAEAGPGRKELEAASESFPSLLDLLEKYAAPRLAGIDLGDIEWYHRLRNQLYHSGNGITVERARVETYYQLASALFQSLFGIPLSVDETSAANTKAGEFLRLWNHFDRGFRAQLPPGNDVANNRKVAFLKSISEEAFLLWDECMYFRGTLVHGLDAPDAAAIDEAIQRLRKLMKLLGLPAV